MGGGWVGGGSIATGWCACASNPTPNKTDGRDWIGRGSVKSASHPMSNFLFYFFCSTLEEKEPTLFSTGVRHHRPNCPGKNKKINCPRWNPPDINCPIDVIKKNVQARRRLVCWFCASGRRRRRFFSGGTFVFFLGQTKENIQTDLNIILAAGLFFFCIQPAVVSSPFCFGFLHPTNGQLIAA